LETPIFSKEIIIGGDEEKAFQDAQNEISLVLRSSVLSKSRATKDWFTRLITFIFHVKDNPNVSNSTAKANQN